MWDGVTVDGLPQDQHSAVISYLVVLKSKARKRDNHEARKYIYNRRSVNRHGDVAISRQSNVEPSSRSIVTYSKGIFITTQQLTSSCHFSFHPRLSNIYNINIYFRCCKSKRKPNEETPARPRVRRPRKERKRTEAKPIYITRKSEKRPLRECAELSSGVLAPVLVLPGPSATPTTNHRAPSGVTSAIQGVRWGDGRLVTDSRGPRGDREVGVLGPAWPVASLSPSNVCSLPAKAYVCHHQFMKNMTILLLYSTKSTCVFSN